MKNKKDLRVEIVKSLEGKRKFNLYWTETTSCSTEVEAKDKDEAEEIFFKGIDCDDVDYGDTDWDDNSLEIEEVK